MLNQPLINLKWEKVFKNGPSKICGRQPLKIFTWSVLEYLAPNLYGNPEYNSENKHILTIFILYMKMSIP